MKTGLLAVLVALALVTTGFSGGWHGGGGGWRGGGFRGGYYGRGYPIGRFSDSHSEISTTCFLYSLECSPPSGLMFSFVR